MDALGFNRRKGHEDVHAILPHSEVAADVIDTLIKLQVAMSGKP